jgi:polar amino acid transport system substrate-binding protein
MNISMKWLAAASAALAVAACGAFPQQAADRPTPEVLAALAPTGKLRVGLYPGSPTSVLPGEGSAGHRGVGYELGAELARQAGVPFDPVILPGNEKVQEAMREGRVDLVFTNATAERAKFTDFTPPVVRIEKSYLVPPASRVQDPRELDRDGVRIGFTRGSTTSTELGAIVTHPAYLPQATLDDALRALAQEEIDAFASNKAILFQMSDRLPGSRVLPGSWGEERIALGVPKGRAAALDYVARFAARQSDAGMVRAAAQRAGLRGLARD